MLRCLKRNKEDMRVEDENNETSLIAFFLSFAYYFAKREWGYGIVMLVLSVSFSVKYYFVLGILSGFIFGTGGSKSKKVSMIGVLISCISVLVFCALKVLRFRLLGKI